MCLRIKQKIVYGKSVYWLSAGQSIVDYVILITIISASLLAMQLFVRRAVQAKLKDMLVASGFRNQSAAKVDVRNATIEANSIQSNIIVNSFSETKLSIVGNKFQFNFYSNSFQDGEEI